MFEVGKLYRDKKNGAILGLVEIDKGGDFIFLVLQDDKDSYYSDVNGYVGLFNEDAKECLETYEGDEGLLKMFKSKEIRL